MSSKPDNENPVRDQPAPSAAHAYSPQMPLQGRILRDNSALTTVKYLDLRVWKGSMIEVSSDQEMFLVGVESATPGTVPVPANDHTVTVDGSGDPDHSAIDEDVMGRYVAGVPVPMVVHPKRPFLAYALGAGGWLQVVRR